MSSKIGEAEGQPYGDAGTRLRILEAARAVLAEQGSALRLADVAARAGVSRQAVYLHFGDRTGLLVALVRHMDTTLALGPSLEHVHGAGSGEELLARAMRLHHAFSAAIDPVAAVLEAEQYQDPALGAAWRDRMRYRRQAHVAMVQRLAELGELGDWPVEVAADLFYALTLPSVWREVTRELDWTPQEYQRWFAVFLRRALLAGD